MADWDQKTRRTRRPRRLEEVQSAEVGFPIAWILIGALSGLIVIGLVGLGVLNIIRKQSITPTPSTIPGVVPTEAVAEAAPGQAVASPTIPPVVTLEPTATPPPTATPVPTLPAALAPDVYAKVIGTDGAGVSMRSGPGTNNARLTVANEDSIVLILKGPEADENQEDFVWWYIRDEDQNEGWVVQDFLEPSLPPEFLEQQSGN
ncbi:MAG: SH3 domain-containing protein [Anaerolineaceae bacterium]|nr:SH3 domain-containing protein [Anaerolineaceae bacterium]